MTALQSGMTVRTKPEHAWVFGDSPWQEKLAMEREGVIVHAPMCARETGVGTIQVRWQSLTSQAGDPDNWTMWIDSRLVEVV